MGLHRPLAPNPSGGVAKQINSPEQIDAAIIQWNLPPFASDPSPVTCQLYWNTTLKAVRVYDPAALTWGSVGSGSPRTFAFFAG